MPPMPFADAMSGDDSTWEAVNNRELLASPPSKPRRSILKREEYNNKNMIHSNHPGSILRRKQERRSVLFAQDMGVREICHIKDMPQEDVRNTWYNAEEFDAIKKSIISTLRLMVARKPIGGSNDEHHCTRGLEFRTPQGAKLRKKNKIEALTAVWNEQVKQWQDNAMDDEAIRRVYQEHSDKCRDAALRIGIKDEKVAQKYVREGRDGESSFSSLESSISSNSTSTGSDPMQPTPIIVAPSRNNNNDNVDASQALRQQVCVPSAA